MTTSEWGSSISGHLKSRLRRSSFSVVCNFPSLRVDNYVQLGNLLLLITSPMLNANMIFLYDTMII